MLLAVMLVGAWAFGEYVGFFDVFRSTSRESGWLFVAWIGAVGLAVAGALLGALVAVTVLRRRAGGFDCPLCGTRNDEGAAACSACGERFRDDAAPRSEMRERAEPR
jgi:hypothetical protein